jgi:integrase
MRGEEASRKCPSCHSNRIWKDGIRRTRFCNVQRYICRDCGYRFSESPILSMNPYNNGNCQVCVSLTEDAKNLTETEPQKIGLAGATAHDQATMKGDIIQFKIYLTNQGSPTTTVRTYGDLLSGFVKKDIPLYDTEAIKKHIVESDTKPNTKILMVQAYHCFLKWKKIPWEKPRISRETIDTFLSQASEVATFINSSGWLMKPFLQLIWECSLRSTEANNLEWTSVDEVKRTIRIRSTKRGKPRTLGFSEACLNLLKSLPHTSTRVFGDSGIGSKRTSFQRTRVRIARQTGNPRIL